MANRQGGFDLRANFCFPVSLDSGSETDNWWGLEDTREISQVIIKTYTSFTDTAF